MAALSRRRMATVLALSLAPRARPLPSPRRPSADPGRPRDGLHPLRPLPRQAQRLPVRGERRRLRVDGLLYNDGAQADNAFVVKVSYHLGL